MNIQGYVWLRAIQVSRQWEDITLQRCALDHGVVLLCSGERRPNKIVIGRGAYINRYTMFDAHLSIEVGCDVMIGPFCFITDGDHGMTRGELVGHQAMKTSPVVIGDGAWLGAHVTVLKGARIGEGAIVGAGSVVTQDVPAYHIALGVPARSVGERTKKQDQ